jgi:nucleotide-binding universal stress UspA family protein
VTDSLKAAVIVWAVVIAGAMIIATLLMGGRRPRSAALGRWKEGAFPSNVEAMNRRPSIVCGVADSHESRVAVPLAAALADVLDHRLVLAHVTGDPPTFPYGDARLRELQRRHAIRDAQVLLQRAAEASIPDVEVELSVGFGVPVEGLTLVCDQQDARLLVVGSRRRHPLVRVLRRDVSSRLARSGEFPLVVVPRDAGMRLYRHDDPGASIARFARIAARSRCGDGSAHDQHVAGRVTEHVLGGRAK